MTNLVHRVVFVTGRPRSGKDSVVSYTMQHLMKLGFATADYSSITPVLDLLHEADLIDKLNMKKTPEERALLSEVGDAVEKYNGFKSRWCSYRVQRIIERNSTQSDPHGNNYDKEQRPTVVFLHVREADMMQRITGLLPRNVVPIRLLVASKTREETVLSNRADEGVRGIDYDVGIANNGTLDELSDGCLDLAHWLALVTPQALASAPIPQFMTPTRAHNIPGRSTV